MVLNFPPEMQYKSYKIIYPFAIPGPNPPGNVESFLWSLFEDMARASDGIWMWDAVDSSYFLNHACICMALGDMLGSAKLNGMAGHSAIYGDRFSMVKGARASLKRVQKLSTILFHHLRAQNIILIALNHTILVIYQCALKNFTGKL